MADRPLNSSNSTHAPGRILFADGDLELNAGRDAIDLIVTNAGDRAVQVGSHYHFFEANPALQFERESAFGRQPQHPVGDWNSPVRSRPNPYRVAGPLRGHGSHRRVPRHDERKAARIRRRRSLQTGHRLPRERRLVSYRISRERYAHPEFYGPTTGDRVRLADTNLFALVEDDFHTYGDEASFGGGKSIRDGMAQTKANAGTRLISPPRTRSSSTTGASSRPMSASRMVASLASAPQGNPDVMQGIAPGMVIGAHTEVIAGEHLILTAGGIDAHVHFVNPQLAVESLSRTA